VEQLLRGMLTVSANDAAVALAEASAGSVGAFVVRMNDEARRFGLSNTQFSNPTGQSDPQNYSSAEDLAVLARRLLTDFPQHAAYFSQREFAYNNVSQANRNKLLWADPAVDGMKTGHLSSAGWSMVATSARAQGSGERSFSRRLIAVVLGAPSETARTQDTMRLLNHGYAAFDTLRLYRSGDVLAQPQVWKGDRNTVQLGLDRDVYVTLPATELRTMGADFLKSQIDRPDPILAPLQKHQTVGQLTVTAGGRPLAQVPLVTLERVEPGGMMRRGYDSIMLWWRMRRD